MTDNTKKILTVVCILILLAIASLYLVIRSESARITTFEECEKAGWLVHRITVYDGPVGSPEKKCELWNGKSFAKEISQEQQRAVEIATAHLSYPVTIIEVKKLGCQGCFSVTLQRDDNQHQFTIVLDNWEIKRAVQSDNVTVFVLPAPFFPTQKEPATSYMQALLSGKPEELIIKDVCLRAGGYLLVWPYGFSVNTKYGVIKIIDDNSQIIMRVGDKIKLGGGEMSGERIAQYSADLPNNRCPGPYWIVGEVITVDKSTSLVATTPALKSAPSQYFSGQAFDESAGNLTKQWDAGNFAGFWREPGTNISTETLVIDQNVLNSSHRVIEKHNLIYTTKSIPLKYQVYTLANKTPPGEGSYSAIGWLGEKYVLLPGNRLARVIFEQNSTDIKNITTGYLWEFEEGYRLLAHSIEAPLERQAWIEFLNGTDKLDERVVPDMYLYSYPADASEIPIFMTYISSIHRGTYEDAGEFKYTWLRSQNITGIREGDILGVMEVTSVKNGIIELRNKEPVILTPGTTIHLMGNIGIQAGSSETELQFYPTRRW